MKSLPIQNIYSKYNTIYYSLREKREYGDFFKFEKVDGIYPHFYEPDPTGKFVSYDGVRLTKISCKNMGEVKKRKTNNSYEADLSITKRFLIDNVDKLIKSNTRWMAFDIETPIEDRQYLEPLRTKQSPYPITNIVIYDNYDKQYIEFDLAEYKSEYEMLEDFCNYIKDRNPDLLMAWNIKNFDYPYLYYRHTDFASKISPISEEEWVTEDLKYPALMTVLDLMGLDHKFTGGKRASYALDNVLQEEFEDEEAWGKTDFINDPKRRKEKCLNDVQRMIKLIEKNNYIETFDSIRIFSKCLWSDLPSEKIGFEWRSNNTRPWHQLFYQIAHKQNKILPCKPTYTEEELHRFENDVRLKKDGAYRDTFKRGIFNS